MPGQDEVAAEDRPAHLVTNGEDVAQKARDTNSGTKKSTGKGPASSDKPTPKSADSGKKDVAETPDEAGGKRKAKNKSATSDTTPVSSTKPGETPPPKPTSEPARETLVENPLHRKLGLRPGIAGLVIALPEDSDNPLLPLPENFRVVLDVDTLASVDGQADYLHFFARSRGELARVVVVLRDKLAPGGSLWVSWIKQSSSRRREGPPGDLNENVIRRLALTSGLVDVKVVALDHDWSALRLVHRKH